MKDRSELIERLHNMALLLLRNPTEAVTTGLAVCELREAAEALADQQEIIEILWSGLFKAKCECEGEYFTSSPSPYLSQCYRCRALAKAEDIQTE